MKEERIQMNLRIPADVKAWLDEQAEQQERSLTWLVTNILRKEMQHAPETVS